MALGLHCLRPENLRLAHSAPACCTQAAAARADAQLGAHAAELQLPSQQRSPQARPSQDTTCRTLFAWGAPVSPHLAAEQEGGPCLPHHATSADASAARCTAFADMLQSQQQAGAQLDHLWSTVRSGKQPVLSGAQQGSGTGSFIPRI